MSPSLRALCLSALGLYLAFAALLATHVKGGLDPAGSPIGYDFSAYYEAAQFARRGEAARAYDDATIAAAEQSRFAGAKTKLPWNYPPTFQLLLLPFSALPYIPAFALWSALLLAGLVILLRALSEPPALWPLLLFPGAIINLFLGANGLLLALFVGGGLVLLDKRPLLAGLLFGFATFKPHLALLIPVALLFGGRTKALAGMLGTVLLLAVGTTLAFGPEAWLAFFAKMTQAAGVAEASSSDWSRVPTVYTLMQVLGLGKPGAALLHGAAALAAAGAVAWIWRSGASPALRMGALGAGLLIVTPYARIYDLALLLFPLIALAAEMKPRPFALDRPLIAAAWIAPLLGLLCGPLIPWLSLLMPALLTRLTVGLVNEPLALQRKTAPYTS